MCSCDLSMFGMNATSIAVRRRPFKHAFIEGFFTKERYERLQAAFFAKRNGVSEGLQVRNYGALIKALQPTDASDFYPLFDPDWLRMMTKVFGVETSLEVDAAIHSHPPLSASGWIHNDFNPGWFCEQDIDRLQFSSEYCHYKTGECTKPIMRIQRMRYITLIFYLGNEWEQGCGGETGIFDSCTSQFDCGVFYAPPVNNCLLLFECSPHSWHSFIGTKIERNSVTLWLHRSMESTKQQWPYHDPVYWT